MSGSRRQSTQALHVLDLHEPQGDFNFQQGRLMRGSVPVNVGIRPPGHPHEARRVRKNSLGRISSLDEPAIQGLYSPVGGDALPPQELLSATLGRLKSVLVDMSLNPSSRISIEWSVQQIESLCDNRAFKDDDKSFRRQFAMQRAISGDTKIQEAADWLEHEYHLGRGVPQYMSAASSPSVSELKRRHSQRVRKPKGGRPRALSMTAMIHGVDETGPLGAIRKNLLNSDVLECMAKFGEWDFDVFRFSEAIGGNQPLLSIMMVFVRN